MGGREGMWERWRVGRDDRNGEEEWRRKKADKIVRQTERGRKKRE